MRHTILSYITLAYILILCDYHTHANENQHRDVLYLNNGNIIQGRIVELKIGEIIKIEIVGGSQIVYRFDEAQRIVFNVDVVQLRDGTSIKDNRIEIIPSKDVKLISTDGNISFIKINEIHKFLFPQTKALEKEIELPIKERSEIVSLTCIGLGLTSLVLAYYFDHQGDQTYSDYLLATNTEDAIELFNHTIDYDRKTRFSLCVGGSIAAFGIIHYLINRTDYSNDSKSRKTMSDYIIRPFFKKTKVTGEFGITVNFGMSNNYWSGNWLYTNLATAGINWRTLSIIFEGTEGSYYTSDDENKWIDQTRYSLISSISFDVKNLYMAIGFGYSQICYNFRYRNNQGIHSTSSEISYYKTFRIAGGFLFPLSRRINICLEGAGVYLTSNDFSSAVTFGLKYMLIK